MATPKSRTSKARKHSRFANWKISEPSISECSRCHEPKLNHRVCRSCGYYDGQEILVIEKEKKTAE